MLSNIFKYPVTYKDCQKVSWIFFKVKMLILTVPASCQGPTLNTFLLDGHWYLFLGFK